LLLRRVRPLAPQAGPDIIEISSDSEPEAKVQFLSKKRTLSAPTNDPPSKRQQLMEAAAGVIELLSDSDDDIPSFPTIKAEPLPSMIPISSKQIPSISEVEEKPQIKLESTQSRSTTVTPSGFKLRIDESAKDSEGRYIVTKKVKVDSVESLSEVPKRWPVPPEDTTVAYVINLSEDKRWQDGTSKEKAFDRFLKQEVTSLRSWAVFEL
jgi:hypothetical protein